MLTVRPGDHIGTPYAAPGDFVRRTAAFAEQGLAAGAAVLIFPGAGHFGDLDAFGRRLTRRSPAIRAATGCGRVRILDSRQVQPATGRFDAEHLLAAYTAATDRALIAGYSGLWVSVDMSWAADVAPAALVGFETEALPLFSSRDLTAICHYDTAVFGPARVTAACRAHPIGPESRCPLRHQRLDGGRTLRVTGETDLANAAAFAALIDDLRPGDTLDISAMSFLDVRALTAIVRRGFDSAGLTIRASPAQSELLELVRAAVTVPARRPYRFTDEPG